MLQELLDAPADQVPIFAPVIGPAIVARRQYVLTCLTRDDLFTVDPYAAKMARGMDDPARASGAFSHFLLGTDGEALYRPDDVLLRSVITSDDADRLTRTTRTEAERWASRLRDVGELDVVSTLARTVPLRIVGDYLGVPWSDQDTPAPLPSLRGGDSFPLDDDLVKVFTFNRITTGVVPTEDQLFDWIKDVFRDVFNNFGPPTRQSVDFTERGLEATEYLTAYIHALLIHYRSQLRDGRGVPDTMLTRLLRLQLRVAAEGDERLRAALGPALPPGTAAARLSDSMIRSNVFGTVVGAVVNPQEATARIVDSLLRLQDGEYPVRNGSSYSARRGGGPDRRGHARLRRESASGAPLQPGGAAAAAAGGSPAPALRAGQHRARRRADPGRHARSSSVTRGPCATPWKCRSRLAFDAAQRSTTLRVPAHDRSGPRSRAEPAVPAARLRSAQVPRPVRLGDHHAGVGARVAATGWVGAAQ